MNKPITPAEIATLPAAERLRLIELLWDSLDIEAGDAAIPDWHQAEIDNRLGALEAGTSTGTSWSEVRQRIEGS